MFNVFPTHVGMNRHQRKLRLKAVSIPHARGDEPVHPLEQAVHSIVFPTHVGMNRVIIGLCPFHPCIPHARGDEPSTRFVGVQTREYSPRTWG